LQFRTLTRDEIALIWTIDRREVIERSHYVEDGELRARPVYFDVKGWPPDSLAMTPELYECFDRGGVFHAAFDDDRLVGLAVLDTVWLGPRGDLLELKFMHVSRDYRAQGLGGQLFEQARSSARDRDARGLYISATPSENTIRFYFGQGSTLLSTPDPKLFEREPEDIHLECPV